MTRATSVTWRAVLICVMPLVLVAGGCGSARPAGDPGVIRDSPESTGNEPRVLAEPATFPDVESRVEAVAEAAPELSPEKQLPSRAELASALFDAQLYTAAEWLYRQQLEEETNEEALWMRALSLLLAQGRHHDRQTAVELLEHLLESFPSSRYRATAVALIEQSQQIESLEGRLAEARKQLEALRKIDLESPP